MNNFMVPLMIDEFFTNQPFDHELFIYKHQKYPGRMLENLYGAKAEKHFILDLETGKFPLFSDGLKQLLGYHEEYWHEGIDAFWQAIHPDDKGNLCETLFKWIDFIQIFKTEELLNKYTVCFNFRIQKKSGKPVPIILQNIYTSLDKKGNVVFILSKIFDLEFLNQDKGVSLQIFDENNDKVVEYQPQKKRDDINFMPMFQVLNLLKSHNKNSFLGKVREIIQDHIDDEYFGVQELSDALHLSRAQVYRKVLSATNLTPVALIKLIRLEEAAKLLREKTYNVTEVAYMVGFSNPAYFIKNFKAVYSKTPKQYQRDYL